MKTKFILLLTVAMSMASLSVFSQVENTSDENLLDLPGDNLNLYVVLDLFQNSPSIEDFEEDLNDPEAAINNLDLTLDGNVDFIKVATQQNDDDFIFVLQIDVANKEVQDVAVIFVSKSKDEKVSIQIVGDEMLYGENYVIEPSMASATVTPNPAYSGSEVVVAQSAGDVIVVESAPIVHYVYSPVYVPYYPPYYYGYYPPYYRPVPIISIHVYHHNHYSYYHNNHYHGGRGGNTIIIKNNYYKSYKKTRNVSVTVSNNRSNGTYAKRRTTVTPVVRTTSPSRSTSVTTVKKNNGKTTSVTTVKKNNAKTLPTRSTSTAVKTTRQSSTAVSTPSRSTSTARTSSQTKFSR